MMQIRSRMGGQHQMRSYPRDGRQTNAQPSQFSLLWQIKKSQLFEGCNAYYIIEGHIPVRTKLFDDENKVSDGRAASNEIIPTRWETDKRPTKPIFSIVADKKIPTF